MLEAPLGLRAPPGCVRPPPLPTPDWAFWHLCVHYTPPPGAGAGLRPVPAPHVNSAQTPSCHTEGSSWPQGLGAKCGALLRSGFAAHPPSPHLRSAVCRPRGLLHPPVAFQQPIAFLPKRRILKQQAARLTSTSYSYSSSPNTHSGPFGILPISHVTSETNSRFFRLWGDWRYANCMPPARPPRGSKIALFRPPRPRKKWRMLPN